MKNKFTLSLLLAAAVFSAGTIHAQMPGGPEAAATMSEADFTSLQIFSQSFFHRYDTNNTGDLDAREARMAIQEIQKALTGEAPVGRALGKEMFLLMRHVPKFSYTRKLTESGFLQYIRKRHPNFSGETDGPKLGEALKANDVAAASFREFVDSIYNAYDTDKSGGLSAAEATEALNSMKMLSASVGQSMTFADDGLKYIEEHQDEIISREKLGEWMQYYYDTIAGHEDYRLLNKLLMNATKDKEFEDFVEKVFQKYDADNSGALNIQEANKAVQDMSKALSGGEFAEDRLNQEVGLLDDGDDGKIGRDEFRNYLMFFYEAFPGKRGRLLALDD